MENPFEHIYDKISLLENQINKLNQSLREIINADSKEDKPLTVNEAADYLSISKSTIYAKVAKNEIPFNKNGKRLYFWKKDLNNYLEFPK